MATPNYKALVQAFQKGGVDKGTEIIQESLKAKILKPADFDVGRLFEECFGFGAFRDGRNGTWVSTIQEAAGALSTSSFTNISGQIVTSALMDAFESEDFVFTPLIPTVPATMIGPERMADISPIGDEATVVAENKEYPYAGVSEDWITAPEAQKRGLIVALTREVIFQDKTNLLLDRCSNVGYSMGLNLEKRIIDAIVDENDGASSLPTSHRYNWNSTGFIATYNDNTGTHSWDNLAASNGLVDWTDLDAAEQLLNSMTHPKTSEPVVLKGTYLVCTKQNEQTAKRIRNATEINVVTPGFATSGNPTETKVGNPYLNAFEIVTSRLLAARMATDTTWYFGDLKKGLRRKVVFPMQTLQAPAMSHDEFHRDIVKQWRADEASAPFWAEPRAMVKCTA